MDLIGALRTTGAVRAFDGRPVPDEVLWRVLDTARFAPSGGNQQGWRVVSIRDPAIRSRLGELYRRHLDEYLAMRRAGVRPWAPGNDPATEAAALDLAAGPSPSGAGAPSAGGRRLHEFAEQLHEAPALLSLWVDLTTVSAVDRDLGRYTLAGGASIYPFIWSLLLAARTEGLGGVLTTMLTRSEPEVAALVGAPPDHALAAVVVLGYPRHQPTRLRRRAVETFVTTDRFGGPPLTAPPD